MQVERSAIKRAQGRRSREALKAGGSREAVKGSEAGLQLRQRLPRELALVAQAQPVATAPHVDP